MTTEADQRDHRNPLELLRETSFVVFADAFVVRDGSSDETARNNAYAHLHKEGISDPGAIIFCNSSKNRTNEIIRSLKLQRDLSDKKGVQMTIVVTETDDLFNLGQAISGLFTAEDKTVEGIEGKNITILQPNAEDHIDVTDIRSGVRIVALKRGEPAHPMHPTPAH